jgi:hypothetical protein
MKRSLTFATLGGILFASSAVLAQTASPTAPGTTPNRPVERSMPAPPVGAMTESEVRAHISAHGYSDVSNIQKSGVNWTARATKDGKPVQVSVDPNGQVRSLGDRTG